jgi:hypothetical protein
LRSLQWLKRTQAATLWCISSTNIFALLAAPLG